MKHDNESPMGVRAKLEKRCLYEKLGCDISQIMKSYMREEIEQFHLIEGKAFQEAYAKHRRVVLEWMMDVSSYFSLHPTTTHSAMAYLDRLQPNEKFSRYEWQMVR